MVSNYTGAEGHGPRHPHSGCHRWDGEPVVSGERGGLPSPWRAAHFWLSSS